jgi:hypothetical protein
MSAGNEDLEAIRRGYFPPECIRVLLLGESPPPGRGFFYTGDSTLFRQVVPVFKEACGFPDDDAGFFLPRFAAAGYYLDDFSPKRGDKPAARPDDRDVRAAIDRLGQLIAAQPVIGVLGLLTSIEQLVGDAVGASDRKVPWRCLPFPHPRNPRNQRLFRDSLLKAVNQWGCGE